MTKPSDKTRASSREYYRKNRSAINARNTANQRARRAEDTQYKLRAYIRNRLYQFIFVRIANTFSRHVGCERDALRARLEMLFLPGMAWDNYGEVWELDHVCPLAAFDLTDSRQRAAAECFANVQPLYRKVNRAKRVTPRKPQRLNVG